MGMLDGLVNGLIGGLGIKKRHMPYKYTNDREFIRKADKPCTIYLTSDLKDDAWSGGLGGFLRGGIKGTEDSVVQHTIIGVSEVMGNQMRDKYPFLLKNKKIPTRALSMEILEEIQEGATVQSLGKYMYTDCQMLAFIFDFTQAEIETILLRAYSLIGDRYDWDESAKHVFDILPNSDKFKNCSSYAAFAFKPVRSIVKKGVKEGFELPSDIYKGLFPDKTVDLVRSHC